jgi:tetratricopeptide (TPR) repeat protein
MSRFQNLEFNDPPGQDQRAEPALKDEAYHLAEAQTAFESGRFESALRAYARAIEHNPRRAQAWTGQVRVLIELGEFGEARVWADKALESFPSDAELLAAKAVALARDGDLNAALVYSDASIEERGDTAYVWLARGDVLLARRERRADFCFEKALTVAALDWFHLWLAARIYAFHQKFARALKLAEQALDRATGRAVCWAMVGQCQAALGLATSAQASFQRSEELDPALARQPGWNFAPASGWRPRLRGWWRRLTSS